MSNQNADPSAVHCKAGVVDAEIIRRKNTGKGTTSRPPGRLVVLVRRFLEVGLRLGLLLLLSSGGEGALDVGEGSSLLFMFIVSTA